MLVTSADRSRAIPFGDNPLDRWSEKREDGVMLADALRDPRARVYLFASDRLLTRAGETDSATCSLADAEALGASPAGALLLGLLPDGAPRFAARLAADPDPVEGIDLTDLRTLAAEGRFEAGVYGQLAQARSMLGWHERHGFCANCGHPTAVALGGYRRDCGHCAAQHFPRVDPVAIMLVSDGDRALLGRQARFRTGNYSCLAGFVEPGESMEDAVRRETFEEAGIRVGRVTFHSSQPWPFVSSLMLGCHAEALSTEITVDETELEDCRWFGRGEVARMVAGTHPDGLTCPPPLAIARHLIEHWLREG
ncbi:MAG TPA: NAD(+) diphosphatase [Methylomirabilota bacterium]|nr:NAD(+) diphosphatase [Methylomirabilota bacterium]